MDIFTYIMIDIPKICLNMIVKNESKIIERLLTSVLGFIDEIFIVDTGSSDNTIEKIMKWGLLRKSFCLI